MAFGSGVQLHPAWDLQGGGAYATGPPCLAGGLDVRSCVSCLCLLLQVRLVSKEFPLDIEEGTWRWVLGVAGLLKVRSEHALDRAHTGWPTLACLAISRVDESVDTNRFTRCAEALRSLYKQPGQAAQGQSASTPTQEAGAEGGGVESGPAQKQHWDGLPPGTCLRDVLIARTDAEAAAAAARLPEHMPMQALHWARDHHGSHLEGACMPLDERAWPF